MAPSHPRHHRVVDKPPHPRDGVALSQRPICVKIEWVRYAKRGIHAVNAYRVCKL
jgi:hypothetical protein